MYLRRSHDRPRTPVLSGLLLGLVGCFDFDAVTGGKPDAGRDAAPGPIDGGSDAAGGPDAGAPRCPPGFPTWVDTTTEGALPAGAVLAGNEAQGPDAGYYPVHVCRVVVAGDVFPGKLVAGIGCLYTVDGVSEGLQGAFQLLIDAPTNPCLTWQKGSADSLPLALVGGIAGSTPLRVCRAFLLGGDGLEGTHAGYVYEETCRITYKQTVEDVPDYEVLVTLLGAPP